MITVKVNGKEKSAHDNLTLMSFLQMIEVNPYEVAVEHNREVINPAELNEIILKDGDELEILRFVGGG